MAADLTGTQLGPYRVDALLGTGGFASVYRGYDRRLNDTVAIKVLADNHALTPSIRERFIAEGHLLRRVDSPAVAHVFDVGETVGGQPYLVLSFADRGDLNSRVSKLRPTGWSPTAAEVAQVVDFLADALSAVHRSGLVHRDVTPANILLRSGPIASDAEPVGSARRLVETDEELLLSDFGFAKDLTANSGLTVGGGTPGFRSPEQTRDLSVVDRRSDVYAASAVVIWLITGVVPDPDRDWFPEVLEQSGSALANALSVGVDPDPRRRFESIDTWYQAVSTGLESVSRPGWTRLTDRMNRAMSGRRKRLVVVALTLAGVVGASVAAVGVSDADDNRYSPFTTQDDGRVRSEARQGDRQLVVVGPETLVVGQPAIYEVQPTNVDNWTWMAPDGADYSNVEAIELTPTSSGWTTLEIRSAGLPPEDDVVVRLRLSVGNR